MVHDGQIALVGGGGKDVDLGLNRRRFMADTDAVGDSFGGEDGFVGGDVDCIA